MLWVHYFDLHQWSQITLFNGEGAGRYDEALAYIDRQLRSWYEIRDRVNILLMSDHGEMLDRPNHAFHTKYLYQELVRVPFLIRIPGVEPDRITTPTALVDFAPTLLDLQGFHGLVDGWNQRSLLGLVGAERPPTPRLISMFERRHVSLIEDGWRYIYDRQGAEWLYNIREDPKETKNVVGLYADRAKNMRAHMYFLRRSFLSKRSTTSR